MKVLMINKFLYPNGGYRTFKILVNATHGDMIIGSICDKTRPSLFTEIEDFEYEDKLVIAISVKTDDKITSAKIQEMCGFTKQQARVVIDKMRNEELLDICRRGNKSYYVRL